MSRVRTAPKTKGKKKKKRKRIIESDNQSENDEEVKVEEQCEPNLQAVNTTELNEMLDINKQENFENNTGENNVEIKDDRLQEAVSEVPIPQVTQPEDMVPNQKIKKVDTFTHTFVDKKICETEFLKILINRENKISLSFLITKCNLFFQDIAPKPKKTIRRKVCIYSSRFIIKLYIFLCILKFYRTFYRLFMEDFQTKIDKKRKKY